MVESVWPARFLLMTLAMRWKSSKRAPSGISRILFSMKPASVMSTVMTRRSSSGRNCRQRNAACVICGARTNETFFVTCEMMRAVS